jgi:ribosomal protein S27E
MPTYLVCGAEAKCPKCGNHRFSGPVELHPQDKVTCVNCGHVCTAGEAIEAGRLAAKVESQIIPHV